jgi:hypothetical protein
MFNMAVGTADAGKPAARVAAVEAALHDLLDNWAEEAVLLLEAALILGQEPVEIMEQHPIEDSPLGTSRTINSCHSRSFSSRNRPAGSKYARRPYSPGRCRERPRLFASGSQQELIAISMRRQHALSKTRRIEM